jgi:hypothetical protein
MTNSEKFQLVKKACDAHTMCEVQLINEPVPRIVQPIGVCLTIKRGLIIVCRQTDGYSRYKSFQKACNFSLDELVYVKPIAKTFNAAAEVAQDPDFCKDWIVHV